jgi:hypothetical protein
MWIHRIHLFAGSPRTAFIVRVGIGRVGIPLGAAVFTWSLLANYATSFEHLQTVDGWLRMLLFAVLCIGEWVIAAGWIAGSLLWLWRQAPVKSKRERRR